MNKSVLRIDSCIYQLTQSDTNKSYFWLPAIGGMPLAGPFVSPTQALNFARERVRVLGNEYASLIEKGEDNEQN